MADAPQRVWLFRWKHGLAWGGAEKGSDPYNPWQVETDPGYAELLRDIPPGWQDLWEVVEYELAGNQEEETDGLR